MPTPKSLVLRVLGLPVRLLAQNPCQNPIFTQNWPFWVVFGLKTLICPTLTFDPDFDPKFGSFWVILTLWTHFDPVRTPKMTIFDPNLTCFWTSFGRFWGLSQNHQARSRLFEGPLQDPKKGPIYPILGHFWPILSFFGRSRSVMRGSLVLGYVIFIDCNNAFFVNNLHPFFEISLIHIFGTVFE
jgi:hypothetical protein